MEEDPKTFEDFKERMRSHWKDEIVDVVNLEKESTNFYENFVYDYTVRGLFIEFLDFQINFKDQIKETEYNQYFKKQNKSDINEYCFPVLPYNNHKYVYLNSNSSESFFHQCVKEIKEKKLHSEIEKFLNQKPSFSYYFWNVTFPHMYCEFISNDFCNTAKYFLTKFQNNETLFLQGSISFIRHNYYFLDTFMKLYFINSQNCTDPIKCVKKSLKRSIEKLTVHHLEILKTLYGQYPKKCKEKFIDDIIIRNIKLWKYSPLYSTSKILFNDSDESELINMLKKHFETEENVNDFFESIFKILKKDKSKGKIASNNVGYLYHNFITSKQVCYVNTFFDILILEKICKVHPIYDNAIKKYIDKFNNGYFIKEAFYYAKCKMTISEPVSKKVTLPSETKLSLDQNLVNKWDNYKQYCLEHNKKPLEFIYGNSQQFQNFIDLYGQKMADVAIQVSYNDWKYYDDINTYLRNQNIILVPLKASLGSLKNYTQVYSIYFASKFPFSQNNFCDNFKNFYVSNLQSYFNNYLLSSLVDVNEANIKIVNDTNHLIFDQLYKDYNNLFDENGISNEFDICAKFVSNARLSYKFNNEDNIKCLKLFLKFLSYVAKSQLIVCYNNYPFSTESPSVGINFDLEQLKYDFDEFSTSGVFDYIFNTMHCLYLQYKNKKKIDLGQFFGFISQLNQLLPQFIEGSNCRYFIKELFDGNGNEVDLTRAIFFYSFNSSKIEIPDSEPQELMNLFFYLLRLSFDETKKLLRKVPVLYKFYDQIIYLLSNLGEKVEIEDDEEEEEEKGENKD